MTHEVQHPENEGKVAVFDTEAEAEAAQAYCYANHMANHNENEDYTSTTTRWDTPRQRLDGKWTIHICHHSDTAGATNLIDYDPADYPEPDFL